MAKGPVLKGRPKATIILRGLSLDDRKLFLALCDGLRDAVLLCDKYDVPRTETEPMVDLMRTAKARLTAGGQQSPGPTIKVH